MNIRAEPSSTFNLVCLIFYSGGEEVVLDTAGRDASVEFDDVGHSEEAWEALEPLLIGTLERKVKLPEDAL